MPYPHPDAPPQLMSGPAPNAGAPYLCDAWGALMQSYTFLLLKLNLLLLESTLLSPAPTMAW
jgi:hypothetical protein